jgi:hypothetical protein
MGGTPKPPGYQATAPSAKNNFAIAVNSNASKFNIERHLLTTYVKVP